MVRGGQFISADEFLIDYYIKRYDGQVRCFNGTIFF